MSKYKTDGSVIPAGIKAMPKKGMNAHYRTFGLYKAMVVDVVYPENPANSNGERTEYKVKIRGQIYPNAVDMRRSGSKFNFSERIKTPRTHAYRGGLDHSNFDENVNGEPVYVLMLEGHGDIPIIIGSATHPEHANYKKFSKSDGSYDYDEFNGVEFFIDKDSNYTIQHVGRKSPDGTIENPDAVGSIIKFYGNGDYEIETHGNKFQILGNVIHIENSQGKIFELNAKQILGAGTEKVVLGDTLKTLLDTFCTTIESVIPGSPGQNAASILIIKGAATALKATVATMLSPNSVTD